MAKKIAKSALVAAASSSPLGNEITGCAHIVQKGKVPEGGLDPDGDKYLDTSDRDILITRYKATNGFDNTATNTPFVNQKGDFENLFVMHIDKMTRLPIAPQEYQEIMFYLADKNNPVPMSNGGKDGWMAYDPTFIQNTKGDFFVLRRKFYDAKIGTPYPRDGFSFTDHDDIITQLGRHSDGSISILIGVRKGGQIVNDGQGGEPPGVGTKIPED